VPCGPFLCLPQLQFQAPHLDSIFSAQQILVWW
jgi:hypothetical protein